ncbi:MAG: hypothetical protein JSR33_10465 [Proteobacteria bacterium]|nr:hypothetical protein [Pseudomonadota bacterium]
MLGVQLTTLRDGMFSELSRLKSLDFRSNQLTALSEVCSEA